MKTQITITDLTRMGRNRICVAGYTSDRTCVRPELPQGNPSEDWLAKAGRIEIRPFAIVEMDLLKQVSKPPHTEDWVVGPDRRLVGMLATEQRKAFLVGTCSGGVDSMFGADVCRTSGGSGYVRFGTGARSLGTIEPSGIHEVMFAEQQKDTGERKWDYRLEFTDSKSARYRLAVVDLAFRGFLDHSRDRLRVTPMDAAQRLLAGLNKSRVFLRIGLARKWPETSESCYLQVTGVHTFPDYLEGRCFADFR